MNFLQALQAAYAKPGTRVRPLVFNVQRVLLWDENDGWGWSFDVRPNIIIPARIPGPEVVFGEWKVEP